MTYSILAYDEKTGAYGAAAATGSLCVGGWVLRGCAESGLSASQGTAPSTLWGTDVLDRMRAGESAGDAVAAITGADPGRAHRQLAALSPDGCTGAFTGGASVPVAHAIMASGIVVAGNMLDNARVLPAVHDTFAGTAGGLAPRLLAALNAGQAAGGDSRGLLSAALLIVSRDAAPLSLRIDHADDPLAALAALYHRSQSEPYRSWTEMVPTLDDPFRQPSDADADMAHERRQTMGGRAPES